MRVSKSVPAPSIASLSAAPSLTKPDSASASSSACLSAKWRRGAPWLTPTSRASSRSDSALVPPRARAVSARSSSASRRLPWWYGRVAVTRQIVPVVVDAVFIVVIDSFVFTDYILCHELEWQVVSRETALPRRPHGDRHRCQQRHRTGRRARARPCRRAGGDGGAQHREGRRRSVLPERDRRGAPARPGRLVVGA